MLRQYDDDQRTVLAFVGSCIKGIAHNINTPLSAVMGRAEMLQMRLTKIKASGAQISAQDLERCIKDAGLIYENSSRVSAIVKNAMKICMTAENRQTQPVKMHCVMHDILTLLTADMFFKHQVAKKIHIQDDLPAVQGVAMHFAASFLELFDNSLYALQDAHEKEIGVSVALAESDIRIEVQDSGCGMTPDVQARLLEELNGKPAPTVTETGLQRVRRLLAPYSARYELSSMPGSTMVSVLLPVAAS